MPDETIEARLLAIEQKIIQAHAALEECSVELNIHHQVESANTHEIEKLKRHVVKLQHPEPDEPSAEPVVSPSAS